MENKLKATFEARLEAKLKNKDKTTTAAGGMAPPSIICGNCAKIDSLEKI